MLNDRASIQTEVRVQSKGGKRKYDDGPRSSTRSPSDMLEAPNVHLKTHSSKKRGRRKPVFSGAQSPIEGTQSVRPPAKRREAISAVPEYHPWSTESPRSDDLRYQKTRYPQRSQRQPVKIPIADGGRRVVQHLAPVRATTTTPPLSPSTSSQGTSAPSQGPSTPFQEFQSPSLLTGGFFHNAHSFSMSNPTFSDNSTHHVWDAGVRNYALQELARHSLVGAEFDSSARDPPPRCDPGTRLNIIDGIRAWSKGPQPQLPLHWLYGPAGAGKSAIMQTLAETVGDTVTLGVSLFFSRLNDRANPHFVIPTLAYQLAIHIPEYRDYVSGLVDLDPSILCKSMGQQFRKLIVEPFSTLQFHKKEQNLLMLIDGLDECESEQAQCELVGLIAALSRGFPTPPLLWVISSRPEPHLQRAFAHHKVEKMEVPVDSSEAYRDVESFLRKGFARIRDLFVDVIPLGLQWPSERQFLVVARAAGGLFVFATTVLSFLGDGSLYGDPVSQLDILLPVLDRFEPEEHESSPFASLDALYKHILLALSPSLISTLHQILGFYLFKGTYRPTSLMLVANILNIKQNVLYCTLQRLHSVLKIPPPHEANKRPLRFLHKSFCDFLVNPNRSGPFWLDMGNQCVKICQRYIQTLRLVLEKDLSAISLSWAPPTETTLKTQLLREVKQNWFQIIPEMFTKWGTPNLDGGSGGFLDDFEDLDFSAFDVGDAFGFINLINWIETGSDPSLWWRATKEELPLENFNVDLVDDKKNSIFYRTKPMRWGHYTTDPGASQNADTSLGKQYQPYLEKHPLSKKDFFEDLQNLKKSSHSPPPRVLIIGLNPSRRCAVVLTPQDKYEVEPLVRYYLPLVKAAE